MTKNIATAVLLAGLLAGVPAARALDTTNNTAAPSAAKAVKAKPYPLKTCIVSGEKLGEMGDPVILIYKGQEMKFCCNGCVKDFKKNPDKYLKKLAEAEKALKKSAP
jgi:YHS domain-containing protein